ncbi:MAG: YraN family protein, partial [Flavobacteriaceae bacterium]|nr:YraN family protein [Flavobacteriaceae bacterium]
HNTLGQLGEDLAVDHLSQKGYRILQRNYRFDRAEVDILASKGDILAVVEVKSRSSNSFGDPQEFVKPKQIRNLVKAVDHFIESRGLNVDVRFDIIAITKTSKGFDIEHLEDAFYHF